MGNLPLPFEKKAVRASTKLVRYVVIARNVDDQSRFCDICILCGKPAKISDRKRGIDVYPVRTMGFQESLNQIFDDRMNDQWAQEVKARLEFVRDLPAADAVYHQQCSVNFRTKKQIPLQFADERTKRRKSFGRPTSDLHELGFQQVLKFLNEHADDQITIPVFVEHMKVFCGEDAYSATHMKTRLIKHFGSDVIITELNGKPNIVTFKATASHILSNFYQRPKNHDTEAEKRSIIETAAKLIRSDIKSMDAMKDVYPSPEDISSCDKNTDYVPMSLQTILHFLFTETDAPVKIASIGQAIIQATRPRALIAPLQLGLGIQMHHQFGSKFLADTLHQLGFCVSYSEVQKFESSAAASQGTDIHGITQEHTIQYIADNVDHNLRTLDGHNTFHGMGIIAGVTPTVSRPRPVPRLSFSIEEVTSLAKISIDFFKLNNNQLESLMFEKIPAIPRNDPTWKFAVQNRLDFSIAYWMVCDDANGSGWKLSRQVICCLPSNDRYGPQ